MGTDGGVIRILPWVTKWRFIVKGACLGICAIARAMDKRCNIVMDEVGVGIRRLWDKMLASGSHLNLTIKNIRSLKDDGCKNLGYYSGYPPQKHG